MWEHGRDRSSGDENRGQALTSAALRRWADGCGVVDIFRSLNPDLRSYTFHSARHRSFSRIDFLFASRNLFYNISEASHRHCTLSDHKAVTCLATLKNFPEKAVRWRFNTRLLKSEVFIAKLTPALKEFINQNSNSSCDPRATWAVIKGFIRDFTTSFASTMRKNSEFRLRRLEAELTALDDELQLQYSEGTAVKLAIVKKEINVILRKKAEFLIQRTRRNYHFQGSRPSHLLALKLRHNEQFTDILAIKNQGGVLRTDPGLVNSSFRDFFEKLYSSDINYNEQSCNYFFQDLNLPSLSHENKAELDMPITLAELHDALIEMPRGKAPGIDGIPPELYVAFWDILGPPLFENITAAIQVGSFTRQSNTALISLLLKKDKDPSDCASYRPLSLLNTDIKIFAKVLACRLRNRMTLLCHCDQTGFIRTRIASDNTRRLLHLINYASSIDSPAAALSLDALKAFDRLEWPYLWYTLRRLGFGDSYIKWIKVLYAEPVAQVMSGRQVSQPFPVSRGSRQGCPLSPLLFALSLEPLA